MADLLARLRLRPLVRLSARRRRADGLVLALLAGLLTLLFRHFLFGGMEFLGNPDRVNSHLNILKFHADGIRAGTLSAWNEHQFAGGNTFGIVYTFANPLTYLVALFPPEHFLHVANLVTFALLVLAGWAAYAFIRTVCPSRGYSFVGAALYELSLLVVFNASQNDMSFLLYILMPLALLALRGVRPGREAGPFLGLALLLWVLCFFTFLQTAAYVVLFLSAYALHRAARGRCWAPLRVFGLAMAVASLGAWPRIETVRQEMALVIRNTPGFPDDGFHYMGPRELLRFFADNIYGRNQQQSDHIGNVLNNSEGMLLYVSSFAAFMLVAGLCRYRGQWFRLLRYRDGDASFLAWSFGTVLAVIFIKPLHYLFYLAFLGANFYHTRLICVAVLPACALVAVLLRAAARGQLPARLWAGAAVGGTAAALVVHGLAISGSQQHRIVMDQPLPRLAQCFLQAQLHERPDNGTESSAVPNWPIWFKTTFAHPYAVRQLGATLALLALFAAVMVWARQPRWRSLAAATLGVAMIGQLFLSSNHRVNADTSRPAEAALITNHSDIQAARAFRPPSNAAVAAFAERLERTAYRTALVSPSDCYPTHCPPHLAHFWKLRLVEGYGTALSSRLFALPWPPRSFGLQSVSFQEAAQVNWPLLALANVKYLVVVNDAFYANGGPEETRPADVAIVENAYPVTPRVFFARQVEPAADLGAALTGLFGDDIARAKPWAFRTWSTERRAALNVRPDHQVEHYAFTPAVDVTQRSFVEGWTADGAMDSDGPVHAEFKGDRIVVTMGASAQQRFLVLNELYHPAWRATCDGRDAAVYPTNVFMRGVAVPAGTTQVVLEFCPFVTSAAAKVCFGVAAFLWLGVAWRLRRSGRSGPATVQVQAVRVSVSSCDQASRRQTRAAGVDAEQSGMEEVSPS